MLYGMGTVVLFLALLVLATTAMSRLIIRYFPEDEPANAAQAALQRLRGGKPQAPEDRELVAVIAAAIRQHRNRTK